MLIGYARISTQDQTLALQRDALLQAGCDRIFEDTISGARAERPGLSEALSFGRSGDTLVVWRLDRLGRSLQDLIVLVNQLASRGIGLKTLQEQMDTSTPSGKLVFHIFGSLAEFERELIRERTNAGLAAARARGRFGGRPRLAATDNPKLVARAQKLYDGQQLSIREICATLHLSKTTLYRYVHVGRKAEEETRKGVS